MVHNLAVIEFLLYVYMIVLVTFGRLEFLNIHATISLVIAWSKKNEYRSITNVHY